jgi:hypothetical protein
VLADLYMRAGACPARPPSKATIWRVITDANAEVFDPAVAAGYWANCTARWPCRMTPRTRRARRVNAGLAKSKDH